MARSRRAPSRAPAQVVLAIVLTTCTEAAPVTDRPVGEGPAVEFSTVRTPSGQANLQALVEAQIARNPGPLLEGLRDFAPGAGERAALGLASLQDRESVGALGVRLGDERSEVAGLAAFALGRLGTTRAAGHLVNALGGEDRPEVRIELIQALGFAAGPEHLATLTEGSFPAEELAAVALAVSRSAARGVREAESLDWLVGNLEDEDAAVRLGASYYFARASDPAMWSSRAPAVRAALASLDANDGAARYLLTGLAATGNVDDTPLFVAWTRSSQDWRTRAAAVVALRDRVGDRVAGRALLNALNDPSGQVVEAAAVELARSRPGLQDHKKEILGWIHVNAEKWQAVSQLFSGLAPLGEGTRIAEWLQGLPPDQIPARVAGIEALSRVPGPAFLDLLFAEAGGDEARTVAAAYRGLSPHWATDRSDPLLLERYEALFLSGISHSHPTIVRIASRGLTDPLLLERGAASALEAALLRRDQTNPRDAGAAAALVSALAQTRDESWVPLMERYLSHPQSAVRTAAVEGIHSLSGRTVVADASATGLGAELVMDWDAFPDGRPVVVMETVKGTVTMELAHTEAPLSVQTFLGFVEEGAYDHVPFHRVVPNFVAQSGDFMRLDGSGGPGFSIKTELTRIPFRRGALGLASSGKDTEGSQFFIMHSWAPHLENRYTAFGWVTSGMDVVDQLQRGDLIVRMYRES